MAIRPTDEAGHLIKAGTPQSDDLSDMQQGLVDFFGYWNKVAITVSGVQIKIKVEKQNGLRLYLRTKKSKEEQLKKQLTPEEAEELRQETMYNTQMVEAGNATEILRTLLRFAVANKDFQDQMEKCVKESINLATEHQLVRKATEIFDPKDKGNR